MLRTAILAVDNRSIGGIMGSKKRPTLGQRLEAQRKALGLSRRKASDLLGVSDQMVKLYELGVSHPEWDKAATIAAFLDEDRYDVLAELGYITEAEAKALQDATLAGAIPGLFHESLVAA